MLHAVNVCDSQTRHDPDLLDRKVALATAMTSCASVYPDEEQPALLPDTFFA